MQTNVVNQVSQRKKTLFLIKTGLQKILRNNVKKQSRIVAKTIVEYLIRKGIDLTTIIIPVIKESIL